MKEGAPGKRRDSPTDCAIRHVHKEGEMANVFEKIEKTTGINPDECLDLLKQLRFAYLRLGKLCNAARSCPFTSADCDLSLIYNHAELKSPLGFKFPSLFTRGFQLIAKMAKGKDLESKYQTPFHILEKFWDDIKYHYDCLRKVLNNDETQKQNDCKPTETDLTMALAEHLLGKLAPTRDFIVYTESMHKGSRHCKCGCTADINFGNTGIGHERVWHGYLDVIFSMHEGNAVGAIAASSTSHEESETESVEESCTEPFLKRRKLKENDDDDQEEEGGRNSRSEVKQFLTVEVENQAAAKAIVFSMFQKERHPEFKTHFAPIIVMSSESFIVMMYDAENDILIQSEEIELYADDHFSVKSIMFLWMILHYRTFCSGIKKENLHNVKDIMDVQSGFKSHLSECIEFYTKKLKGYVGSFDRLEKQPLLTNNIMTQKLKMTLAEPAINY